MGIWHLDDAARFAAFRETSDRWRFVPGAGLPARILVSAKPEWMVDLADEELSPRARVAEQAGLRSGFGFPIVAEEKVVGVLEFFSLETVQPDEELLTMLGHLGSQLGQVILRQRAEEDLQRAKASAESANRAKSEFLTTMSHEMRTPMNAILGMADLLSESSLGEEQRDYVRVFQKAGANLLDLINNILDLSKVESGHVELEVDRLRSGGSASKNHRNVGCAGAGARFAAHPGDPSGRPLGTGWGSESAAADSSQSGRKRAEIHRAGLRHAARGAGT